ncbi:MAG: alpha/beta hydrolase, partial [Betaproteobacteria bacterium]|nr:alpha/beta hydrolase [Betaproteobacteria bacterium]
AQWEHVVRSNARQRPDGRWGLAYDPRIAVPFRAQPAPPDLWPLWDAIRCPTLVLRGAESDLLSTATASEMSRRGPCPQVVEVPGVGHAPMLLDQEQVGVVVNFIRDV